MLHNIPFLVVNDETPKRFDCFEKRMHRVFRDTLVPRWGSISRHIIDKNYLCFLLCCANNSVKDVAKLLRSISKHINVDQVNERFKRALGCGFHG